MAAKIRTLELQLSSLRSQQQDLEARQVQLAQRQHSKQEGGAKGKAQVCGGGGGCAHMICPDLI